MLVNHGLFLLLLPLVFFVNNKPLLCDMIEWNDVNDQVQSIKFTNTMEWKDLVNHHLFQIMKNKIRRFGSTIAGAFVVQHGVGRARDDYDSDSQQSTINNRNKPQSLSHNPCSLIELWREWKHGIVGRKPTEQFTTTGPELLNRKSETEMV